MSISGQIQPIVWNISMVCKSIAQKICRKWIVEDSEMKLLLKLKKLNILSVQQKNIYCAVNQKKIKQLIPVKLICSIFWPYVEGIQLEIQILNVIILKTYGIVLENTITQKLDLSFSCPCILNCDYLLCGQLVKILLVNLLLGFVRQLLETRFLCCRDLIFFSWKYLMSCSTMESNR